MYSKYFVNISSLIVSSVITIIIAIFVPKVNTKISSIDVNKEEKINQVQNNSIISNSVVIEEEKVVEKSNIEKNTIQNAISSYAEIENKEETWQLMIPKIDLIAPIKEGTEQFTISKTIGHFTETSTWDGNIGLASHNRGMRANFFENIKNLIKSDIIIYQKGEDIRQYEVVTIAMIQDNDWSYLQPTEDNRITLITCVRNQPDYRLCVQGIQI